jgi:carboxyl-terminal processing protease
MQSTFSYSDGSSVTLTIAYYAPPSGVNYHGVGVEPDVTVELEGDSDLQYDAAIEELKKLINANNS